MGALFCAPAFAQTAPLSDSLTIFLNGAQQTQLTQFENSENFVSAFAAFQPINGNPLTPFLGAQGGLTVLVDPGAAGFVSQAAIDTLNAAGLTVLDLNQLNATLTGALATAGIRLQDLSDVFGITGGQLGLANTYEFGFASDIENNILSISTIGIPAQLLNFKNETGTGTFSGDNFLSVTAINAGYSASFFSDVTAVPEPSTWLMGIGTAGALLAGARRRVGALTSSFFRI